MSNEKSMLEPYEGYKETQIEIAAMHTRKVRNAMFYIAVILLIGDLLSIAMANRSEPILFISAFIFPAIFAGIGLLALKQPMLAVIIGAVVFAFILLIQILFAGGVGVISGLIIKGVIVYLLISAYQNAKEVQKAKKEIEMH